MLAQIDFDALKKALPSPSAYPDKITDVVSLALKFIFPAAGILLLFYLIVGGFSLMSSGGDPKAVQGAKGKITSALIGFVVIFAAYWIVQIVGIILGLDDIRDIF
ncbi:hypothetical protein HY502_01615 [Candidatus Woesebacteria bacterium]|nr:hypothetical protein [Candidatus Woesebacteria bacterium]